MGGISQISDANLSRVPSAARAPAGHNRNLFVAAQRNQAAFVCQAVDGIDDEVIGSVEQRFSVGFSEELRQRAHVALGIDAADTLGHDFDFGPTDVGV